MNSGASADEWLVVIDPQVIFSDPSSSPWGSPMWTAALPHIVDLATQFEDRVVVTRFVADDSLSGSWTEYYQQWPFALVDDADPLYSIVPELAQVAAPVVTEPTFGKWSQALQAIVGRQPSLTLAGVATDCCVLSTALAAADAGATLQVVGDACAGSSPQNHQRALEAMNLYAPQITIV